MNLISSSIWISIKNFPKHEVLCLYFAMIQEIPQHFRPKPKSSGFGVEANLDFHDNNFFSHCSNISKQGVYVQVDYQGIV